MQKEAAILNFRYHLGTYFEALTKTISHHSIQDKKTSKKYTN
jgi:hypothetical protein